jgi:hypothetical protein
MSFIEMRSTFFMSAPALAAPGSRANSVSAMDMTRNMWSGPITMNIPERERSNA